MKNNIDSEEMRVLSQTPPSAPPQTPRLSLPALFRSSDKAQRRAGGNIVKFIAALLVLTLVARGTSGATLARVEVANPSRSEIVDAVTGNATVTARDSLDVTVPEGLTIREMLVGQGQSVEAGDAIAALDLAEIQEKLIRATASLDKLLLDLVKLERDEAADSASRENARRNLNRAQEDYNTVRLQGEADVAAARKSLDDLLAKAADNADGAALETAQRNLERAQDDLRSGRVRDAADVASAQTTLDNAIKNRSDSVDYTAVDNASRSLTRARQDHNEVKAQGEKAVSDAQAELDAAQDEGSAAEARAKLAEAEKNAAANLQAATRRVEDAQAAYNIAQNNFNNSSQQASNSSQAAIDNARNALESANRRAADNQLSATRRVEDAQIALAQAELNHGKSSQQLTDARRAEIDSSRNALAAAEKRAEDNRLSAARRVEDAEISLATAERDHNRNAQQSADATIQNSASAIALRLDIDAQKAIVDALQMLSVDNGIIYSDISGVVLAAKSEGNITGKDALVAFMDGAKGYEARMRLDKTDAEKLAVGDECQVTTGGGSVYYSPTVIGTVSAISPPDEQDRVQVVIRLPDADWSDGQRVDVQAIRDRNTYDMCVPLSALRSDNAGYFLLVVEQKNSVLGVENVVARVPVTVAASDSESAAIQGPVSRNSQIITGSNKAVEAGDRIRVNN